MRTKRLTYIIVFVVLFLLEILIALFVHDRFIRPYIGDLLVTVLLCCLCRAIIPGRLKLLPVYVFLLAAFVEFCQYIDVVKLLGLENNVLLSTLIGRTFSISDLFCYALGCLVFWGGEYTASSLLNRRISKQRKKYQQNRYHLNMEK